MRTSIFSSIRSYFAEAFGSVGALLLFALLVGGAGFACGNGACGFQVLATSYAACTDAGAGLCNPNTDGVTLGLADPILANLITQGTLNLQTSTTTNGVTLTAGLPGASTFGETVQSNDPTNCPNGGTNGLFAFLNGAGTNEGSINCGGQLTVNTGLIAGTNVTATSGIIKSAGTANGTGEITSGNAAGITGALGIGAIQIGAGGMLSTGNSCAQSTSAKAATLTSNVSCVITVIAADVAGPFTITYKNAPFNTAPQVFVQMGTNTNAVSVKSVVPGLSSVVITLSASVATNDTFQMFLVGGK